MLLAVFTALIGSYANRNSTQRAARDAVGLMLGMSKSMLGTQGGGGAVYAIAFFAALGGRGGDGDDDDAVSSYPYY